jgi:hypothetical protein
MRLNFFDWIREGVKQSVLLGISDAATQIGSPEEVDQLNDQLFKSFKKPIASRTRGKRKALGRSLSDCMPKDE